MRYLFLDLETTGLNPQSNRIIEVGVAVVESDTLEVLEKNSWVLKTNSFHDMDDWCCQQHTSSGLVNECLISNTFLDDVEAQLLDIIDKYWKAGELVVLAGNSIQFDRQFIKETFLKLEKRLHYRMFDITSVRMFVQDMGGKVETRNRERHRSLADIEDCIRLLSECRSVFL